MNINKLYININNLKLLEFQFWQHHENEWQLFGENCNIGVSLVMSVSSQDERSARSKIMCNLHSLHQIAVDFAVNSLVATNAKKL